mmetsp:Transcript_4446/g.10760  ORF Transcript_4446/g.10760 Transcript_4446/m.10760 type:complete len:759 (+) Transcript_4446:1078-3354(+)
MGHEHWNLVLREALLQCLLLAQPFRGLLALLDDPPLFLVADVGVLGVAAACEAGKLVATGKQALRRGAAGRHLPVPLLHGFADLLELVELLDVDRPLGVLALVVQPLLHVVELLEELVLNVRADEVRVGVVDLVAHVIDIALEGILALVCLLHRTVNLLEVLLGSRGLRERLRRHPGQRHGEGDIRLSDPHRLLRLLSSALGRGVRGRGILGVRLGGLLAVLRVGARRLLLGRGLLHLRLLDGLDALEAEDTVQVDVHLDLELGLLLALWHGDRRPDLEVPDVAQRAAREVGGGVVVVVGTDGERLGLVEGEHLRGGDRVAALENSGRGRLPGLLLPGEVDGVRNGLLNAELLHAEDRREHRALQRAPAADALLRVHGAGRLLPKKLLHGLKQGRDAGGAADELHVVNVLGLEPGLVECRLERPRDARDDARGELVKLLPGHVRGDVRVLHEALHAEGSLWVGAEDLLQLFAGHPEAEAGALVRHHVELFAAQDLLHKVVKDDVVKVTAAKMTVPRRGEDPQLALLERDDTHLQRHLPRINNCDVNRLVVWQVGLVDPIAECSCCRVVHQAKAVEVGNTCCVKHSVALRVGEVHRHGEDAVCDGEAIVLPLCNDLEVCQHHPHHGLRCVGDIVAQGINVDKATPVRGFRHPERKLLYVSLHVVLLEFLAQQTLEVANSVLDVSCLDTLCICPYKPLFLSERNKSRRFTVALLVQDDVHASLTSERHATGCVPNINSSNGHSSAVAIVLFQEAISQDEC